MLDTFWHNGSTCGHWKTFQSCQKRWRPTCSEHGLKCFSLCDLLTCPQYVYVYFVMGGPVCVCVYVCVHVYWHKSVTQTNPIRFLSLPISIFTSPLSEIKPGIFCKRLCRSIATILQYDLLGVLLEPGRTIDCLSSFPRRSASWLSNHLDNRMLKNHYRALRGKRVTSVISKRTNITVWLWRKDVKQFRRLYLL